MESRLAARDRIGFLKVVFNWEGESTIAREAAADSNSSQQGYFDLFLQSQNRILELVK